eukprot:7346379-Prymnesium_polylepis.1
MSTRVAGKQHAAEEASKLLVDLAAEPRSLVVVVVGIVVAFLLLLLLVNLHILALLRLRPRAIGRVVGICSWSWMHSLESRRVRLPPAARLGTRFDELRPHALLLGVLLAARLRRERRPGRL